MFLCQKFHELADSVVAAVVAAAAAAFVKPFELDAPREIEGQEQKDGETGGRIVTHENEFRSVFFHLDVEVRKR